ncbi:MAG: hypothetical protein N2053_11775, partial [Chitinispirillaceae bacterium]|nr:hypothetical protein [Chitinispirillaceae bacterium]
IKKEGLVMLIIHPDYTCFEGEKRGFDGYDVKKYEEFLSFLTRTYYNTLWNPLPQEICDFVRQCNSDKKFHK